MNVKKSTLSILTAVFALAATSLQAQDLKIGLVDMQKALNEFNKTAIRTNEINASATTFKTEGEKRGTELKALAEKIQALTLEVQDTEKNEASREKAATERGELAKQYQEKQNAAVAAGRKAAEELAKARKDMENELVAEITEVMKAEAGKNGVDLIFDKSFLPRANKAIIYVSPKVLDLTEEIVKILNSK